MTPALLSSSTLTGDEIVNRDDVGLGTLKDLMIDLSTGEVAYAVLARGGVGGVGQQLFAIPWRMLTVDGENKPVVVDVDEEVLDNSPGFAPDNWPSFADPDWRASVDRHFGSPT